MALANHLISSRFELEDVSRRRAAGVYYGEHRMLCRLLGDYLAFVDTHDFMLAPRLVAEGENGRAAILRKLDEEGVTWALVQLGNVDESMGRFRLTEKPNPCGTAAAELVVGTKPDLYGPRPWCERQRDIEVVDSLAVVPPSGLLPGAFGWAKWMPDSRSWEVLYYGEGCCGASSSSGSESSTSSSGSSASSSSLESSRSGSSGSAPSSLSESSRPSESSAPSESGSPSSAPSESAPSESGPPSSAPSESAPPPSSAPSESGPPGSAPSESGPPLSASSWGSAKSTAIVPASWTPGGYTALFTLKSPEVLFEDILLARIPQKATALKIDPRFVQVCEPHSLVVSGCVPDVPVVVGAHVDGDVIRVRFAEEDEAQEVKVVLRLTGVRRGFAGLRFPNHSRRQFEANEAWINSAYPPE